jgi:hypothetical protein
MERNIHISGRYYFCRIGGKSKPTPQKWIILTVSEVSSSNSNTQSDKSFVSENISSFNIST